MRLIVAESLKERVAVVNRALRSTFGVKIRRNMLNEPALSRFSLHSHLVHRTVGVAIGSVLGAVGVPLGRLDHLDVGHAALDDDVVIPEIVVRLLVDHQQLRLAGECFNPLDHLVMGLVRDVDLVHLDYPVALAQAGCLAWRAVVHFADELAVLAFLRVQVEPVAGEIVPLDDVAEPGARHLVVLQEGHRVGSNHGTRRKPSENECASAGSADSRDAIRTSRETITRRDVGTAAARRMRTRTGPAVSRSLSLSLSLSPFHRRAWNRDKPIVRRHHPTITEWSHESTGDTRWLRRAWIRGEPPDSAQWRPPIGTVEPATRRVSSSTFLPPFSTISILQYRYRVICFLFFNISNLNLRHVNRWFVVA